MTKYRSRILIMALLLMAFTVSTVQAQNTTWEIESIETGADDGFIAETGTKFFDTPWVQIKSKTTSLTSYFAFRDVDIPSNATILNAYLQFTAPAPVTFAPNASLDVTIYGIKAGELTSWDPTPDLDSAPFTTAFTNWDATPLSSSAQINVTITDQVTEIYEMFSWTEGNDMGFRIVSVLEPSILAARYQVAYDSDPNDVMKLYIEYLESNSTSGYYKGHLIVESPGNQMTFSFNDFDVGTFNMSNVIRDGDGTDIRNKTIPGGLSFLAPDNVVSIGNDIYVISRKDGSPFNVTLFKSVDRGLNWTNLGDIDSNGGSAGGAQKHAMVYDQSGSIHIVYAEGFDTYWKQFNILNQSFTATQMIHDGGFSIGQHRAYWDDDLDTVWFTRSGGAPGNSAPRPTVLRRADSDGIWESFDYSTGYIDSDITWVENKMWWVISEDNNWLRAFRLEDYGDLSSWVNIGGRVGELEIDDFNPPAFDIATDPKTEGSVLPDKLIVSMSRENPAKLWSYKLSGSSWDEQVYNASNQFGEINYEIDSLKMYYIENGQVRMGAILEFDSRDVLVDRPWFKWGGTTVYGAAGVTGIVAEGPDLQRMGGDMFPFSEGLSGNFTVYDANGSIIGTFTSLEDAQAAIDDIPGVGVTPDDPNPPGTDWAEEGAEFGSITRFNMRFVIWGVGWFLIIGPVIIMCVKPWPLKVYLIFFLCVVLGFGLQWSIGSI